MHPDLLIRAHMSQAGLSSLGLPIATASSRPGRLLPPAPPTLPPAW